MKHIDKLFIFLWLLTPLTTQTADLTTLINLNETFQLFNKQPIDHPSVDSDKVFMDATKTWNDNPDILTDIYSSLPNISPANLEIVRNIIQIGIQLRLTHQLYSFEGKYRTLIGAFENITSVTGTTEIHLEQIQQQAQKILPLVSPEETHGQTPLDQKKLHEIATLLGLDISAVAYENIDTITEYGIKNPMPGAGFASKIEQLSMNNAFVAKARGDGNCFYRSFLFSFVATTIILNKKDVLQNFIQQFTAHFTERCQLPLSDKQKTICLHYIENQWHNLYLLSESTPINKLLQEIQFIFNFPLFDYLNIMHLRYEIAHYLTKNSDVMLTTDMTIKQYLEALGQTIANYNSTTIVQWGIDAEGILFNIIPKNFHINLIIYDMTKPYLSARVCDNQPCYSFVILKPGHYDAVITKPGRNADEVSIIDYDNFWKMHSDLLTKINAQIPKIDKTELDLLQNAAQLGTIIRGLGYLDRLEIYTQLQAILTLITSTNSTDIDLNYIKTQIKTLAQAYEER